MLGKLKQAGSDWAWWLLGFTIINAVWAAYTAYEYGDIGDVVRAGLVVCLALFLLIRREVDRRWY